MDGARRLSTHVLDTALGRPAAGLVLRLFRLDGDDRLRVAEAITNADGRTDAPLLTGDALAPGRYELEFEAGAYFRSVHRLEAAPLFLDVVPVRFGVSAETPHYHVPLLLSPFGYSTYRGS